MPPKEMVRRLSGEKDSKEIANKYAAQSYCSLANSAMPKANTRWNRPVNLPITCLLRFNHLRLPVSLAWQVRLLMAGTNSTIVEYPTFET